MAIDKDMVSILGIGCHCLHECCRECVPECVPVQFDMDLLMHFRPAPAQTSPRNVQAYTCTIVRADRCMFAFITAWDGVEGSAALSSRV